MSSVRDQIRVAFLNSKPSSKLVTAFGVQVELRTPPVQTVLGTEFNRKTALATMLINYCFVPGTDEHVFDEADVEGIMSMPWNAEVTKLVDEINKITDIGEVMKEEGKESAANSGGGALLN